MNETNDAQIEAGAKALFFEYYGNGWDDATSADADLCRSNARVVLNAAGVVADEPNWEYGWRDERPIEWSGKTNMTTNVVRTVYPFMLRPGMVQLRRRKAGPWEVVADV